MKSKNQAVSPILSTIFILTIMIMVTSSLLIWGVPTVQKLQYESQYFSAKNYFEIIDSSMDEVVREGNGSTRTLSVLLNNGYLLSEKFTERWIVYYDLLPDQNITYSGLDDNDTEFTIYTNISRINITVYWIENGIINHTQSQYNLQVLNETYRFSNADYPLIGYNPTTQKLTIIKIEVDNYTSGERASELWLFDIGAIKFVMQSPIGFYSIKEINSAIVIETPGGTFVEDSPYFIEREGKTLSLGLIQLNSSGGGSGSVKVKMKNEYSDAKINRDVYNLRVEIFTTEKSAFVYSWYNSFTNYNQKIYGFSKENYDRILYKTDDKNKVELKLIHIIVNVKVGG